jgi:hypothetical protein
MYVKWLRKENVEETEIQVEKGIEKNEDLTPFFEHLTDCFNISISSFGFLVGFYPIYDRIEPKTRTPTNGFFATLVALVATVIIYVSFS